MFDPVNEPSCRLDVEGLSDPIEVLAFTGSEAISEPFVFEVDLLIDDPTLDLASLLYRPAFLHFGAQGNGIHGHLLELVQPGQGVGSRLCRVRVGPKLACLGLRVSQRIFCNRSVPDILRLVLKEHGIIGNNCRFDVSGDYTPQDFCTQYRESDLQFLQRLCAQAGLHYWFAHRADGHCLVFSDEPGQFGRGETVVFNGEGERPGVHPFTLQGRDHRLEGHTHVPTLRSGHWMSLSDHPIIECNRRWLLTRVEHRASESGYRNRIHAVAGQRSVLATPALGKPRMHGLQRAWVVAIDEPQPDSSRPVAVQFDWVYQGEGAAPSHCWLPMAPELADTEDLPLREGLQVLVSFIEGDPDQPLITGFLPGPVPIKASSVPPATAPDAGLAFGGLLGQLQSSEPLALLCLLPAGGSFIHCTQPCCTCRLATQSGQSGAA
ncbi:type VI secretion system Vgr family protein [Pseudomonas arsenicoxydans]|uniref:Type VI secretion protein n=1 Tax=Pseudomonas arsenicoxydans TaxID=702115 RepID=A0A4P6G0Q3_9PSED|nr:contractile injection system protein, VgrG/Pvc8 family [Pseudomonas arsenicoxydans]QAY82730.1 type VI secretion protein [Pseudomonas arsenicoxydans]